MQREPWDSFLARLVAEASRQEMEGPQQTRWTMLDRLIEDAVDLSYDPVIAGEADDEQIRAKEIEMAVLALRVIRERPRISRRGEAQADA